MKSLKRSTQRIREARPCMGGLLEICLYPAAGCEVDTARDAAFAETRRLEAQLSVFREDSELSRLNWLAPEGPVRTSPELFAIIQKTQAISRLSGGVLDLTIGPLMRLWGFREPGVRQAPSKARVRNVLESGGSRGVILNVMEQSITYRSRGIQIDLGAVGKGYAIDRAVAVLKAHGIRSALVSFPSTAYALGQPPGREGWQVGIRHPRNPGEMMESVLLKDRALSTSGDYEQNIRLDGELRTHILDPRTGYPVRGSVSASVVAPTALEADAFSTAAFVLGAEAGPPLLEDQAGVEGLMVTELDPDRLQTTQTPGWRHMGDGALRRNFWNRRQFAAALLAGFGWLMVGTPSAQAIRYQTAEEALHRLMPGAERFQEKVRTLTAAQHQEVQELLGTRFRKKTYTFWKGEAGDRTVGYAVRLNVIGKERPITFLLAISPEGTIMGIEVLVYRESQGSEIRSRGFMRQFSGKSLSDSFKPGRDIDLISGATLSSRSTAYAVRKALALVRGVYLNGRGASP